MKGLLKGKLFTKSRQEDDEWEEFHADASLQQQQENSGALANGAQKKNNRANNKPLVFQHESVKRYEAPQTHWFGQRAEELEQKRDSSNNSQSKEAAMEVEEEEVKRSKSGRLRLAFTSRKSSSFKIVNESAPSPTSAGFDDDDEKKSRSFRSAFKSRKQRKDGGLDTLGDDITPLQAH